MLDLLKNPFGPSKVLEDVSAQNMIELFPNRRQTLFEVCLDEPDLARKTIGEAARSFYSCDVVPSRNKQRRQVPVSTPDIENTFVPLRRGEHVE
jgi:hypothetical protein